jgi:hypothetical protein
MACVVFVMSSFPPHCNSGRKPGPLRFIRFHHPLFFFFFFLPPLDGLDSPPLWALRSDPPPISDDTSPRVWRGRIVWFRHVNPPQLLKSTGSISVGLRKVFRCSATLLLYVRCSGQIGSIPPTRTHPLTHHPPSLPPFLPSSRSSSVLFPPILVCTSPLCIIL